MQPTRHSPPDPKPPAHSTTNSGARFQADRYYRHSGKAPVGGLALTLLLGGAVAIGGAALYILARVYIPYDILNAACNFIFGLAIGGMAGQAAIWGKVRNPVVAGVMGVLTAAVGIYAAWVFWLYYRSGGQVILSPLDIWGAMLSLAENGDWSVRDITPKGVWLFLVWLAEALIILACGWALAYPRVKDLPFCERTGQWLKNVVHIGPFDIPVDVDAVRRHLENGDTSILKSLRPISITHPENYIEIQLRSSTMLYLLSVKMVTVQIVNGQTVKKEKPLVNHMIVDAATWQTARSLQPAADPLPVRGNFK